MGRLSSPDFRALFEAVPGLYLVLTRDLRIAAVSDAYLRATMTTRDAILGRGIFDVFPDNPDDPAASGVHNLRTSLENVLKTGRPDAMAVQKYDVRRPDAEGGAFEERYWSPYNSPVIGPRGDVTYIIHRVEDVTDFIRLKRDGSEREKLARRLQDRAVQMEAEIFERAQQVSEANRQLSQANEALARLYSQIALLMERADDELRVEEMRESDREEPRKPITPEEMLARVGQLITGYKRLEAQLHQSQKMEAVGRLAGGVAHDFNNLLTVIVGYVAMLRDDSVNRATDSALEEVEKAAVRASALTHKLLAFSRKQVLQPRMINLNAVVSGVEEFIRRLIGENIQLVTVLGSGTASLKADPHQIEQVIMNLAVNARDAMPGGGRIVIETRSLDLPAEYQSLKPGAYLLLIVSDTGHGMDQETAAHIFEPFFTTKEAGKGTGLGLATVYGIVEQSGGMITVDSAPGAGTTFRIYLPAVYAAEEQAQPDDSNGNPSPRAATILLAEDESGLRTLISKALGAAGYRVLQAASGEEALALASGSQPIDLLLTDVVMTGMSGPDLVQRLRARRPNCAVLYMSGYDNDLIDQKALESAAGFLAKPFTPRTLVARITEVLGRQRPAEGSGRNVVGL